MAQNQKQTSIEQITDAKLEEILLKLKAGKPLSADEFHFLLQHDPTDNSLKNLCSLIDLDPSFFQKRYGESATLLNLQEDIEKKLKAVEHLLYYKQLERSLFPVIRRNIQRLQGFVRTNVSLLIGDEMLEEKVSEIIAATEKEIKTGEKAFNTAEMSLYIQRVQGGIHEQIRKLETKRPEKDDELFEIYDQAFEMVNFISAQLPANDARKNFLLAYLARKIREGKENRSINGVIELYQGISKSLVGTKSYDKAKSAIQSFAQRIEQKASAERIAHIRDVCQRHEIPIDLNDPEIEGMFKFGQIREVGGTYESAIAFHLNEIEVAEFHIELSRLTNDPELRDTRYNEEIVRKSTAVLRALIQEYRERKIDNPNAIIDRIPATVASPFEKDLLKKAVRFLKTCLDQPDQIIKAELSKIQKKDDVIAFLERKKELARQYLLTNETSKYSAVTLERLENNQPGFSVFDAALQLIDFENAKRERAKPTETGKREEDLYISGAALTEIQRDIDELEKILSRNFSQPGDEDRYRDKNANIDATIKNQYRFKKNEATGITEQLPKCLPHADRARLETVRLLKENQNQFKTSTEAILNLTNFEHEPLLRKGLEALYQDINRVTVSVFRIKDLSKLMATDHPLTMICFHPKTKEPFEYNGHYKFLSETGRILGASGEPATFKQRSQYLLREAQKHLRNKNYAALKNLFTLGMAGDRLFMDTIFFPAEKLVNPDDIIYQQVRDKTVSRFYPVFRKFENFRKIASFANDSELKNIAGFPRLADDKKFLTGIGIREDRQEWKNRREHALVNYLQQFEFRPDGTVVDRKGKVLTDAEVVNELNSLKRELEREGITLASALGQTKLNPAGDLRITKDRLQEISKHYPLIALRAAQMNNELLGWAAGGAQVAARMGWHDVKGVDVTVYETLGSFIRSINWYSPINIWMAVWEVIQNVEKTFDERTKFWTYTLLEDMFEGTILGSEFKKMAEQAEHHRVDEFKAAMKHYGNDKVIEKIYHARDRFEFKAALSEGFEERGIITKDDLLTTKFIKAMNQWHSKGFKIPTKYSNVQMQEEPEVRIKALQSIEDSIDSMWGEGTFQNWLNAGEGKYDSKRKQSSDAMASFSSKEKGKIFDEWWVMLQTERGREALKKMHPGEIVGKIEQDMMEGKLESGDFFGILQAMICTGIIKLQHVIRLQFVHANDVPIHVLLEPKQAQLCGLTKFYEDHKFEPRGSGQFYQFYQGKRAIKLVGKPGEGKWNFLKTQHEYDEAKGKKELQTIYCTVHQFQKYRQAQEENYKRMDNSSIGVFLPAYNFAEIQKALHVDTAGNILNARPHDIVAGYRGFHHVFIAYMQVMGDTKEFPNLSQQDFLRSVWYAYDAICKTQGFASILARYKGRTKDFKLNAFDASPNLSDRHEHTYTGDGKTKYEELILTNQGFAQRMGESQDHLDGLNKDENGRDIPDRIITDELRTKFKLMSGFQFIWGGGVNRRTGKKEGANPERYDMWEYDPSGQFPDVIKAFKQNVFMLARKRGMEDTIRESLDRSGLDEFAFRAGEDQRTANNRRQDDLRKWYETDIKV